MNKITLLLLWLLLPAGLAVAQDSERTSYFPYQTGDFWVNEVYEMNVYYEDERIDVIADSMNHEGEIVYTLSSTLSLPNERIYHISIDSLGNIYSDWWYDKGELVKILDTSKEVGETWIAAKTHTYEIAEIVDKYTLEIFGDSTKVKEILYAANNDSTGTAQEGYHRMYVWWSEKFGILEQRSLLFGGLEPVLKGSKIGELVYGDTTANLRPVSIEPEPFGTPPQSFQMRNYPNPFNSTTNFVIETETPDRFTLEVYDRVGRKVAEIFNNKQFASGRHTVSWQAGNLATGMYFLRLSSRGGVQVQTITYLK